MPIYPYVCTACGHEFDELQKISEAPLTDCPACGEATLRKRLTAPSFKLKGTGWYETDFKDSGKKKATGGDGKDDTSGGKSDQDKGTKTADGKEPKDTAGTSKGDAKSPGKSESPAASANKDK